MLQDTIGIRNPVVFFVVNRQVWGRLSSHKIYINIWLYKTNVPFIKQPPEQKKESLPILIERR
ncbi:hypothetical protein DDZ14_13525 [Maritimibacter sp. 55A14]|nr:hypothetical protein DDZ14_13525 [Maritimibacter sp. 55A14]